MTETINEDGTPVLIEAVYYRYYQIYAATCDTVEEAVRLLRNGEKEGSLSAVGVFVEGKPHPPSGVYSWEENSSTAMANMAKEYKNLPPRPKDD